MFKWWKGLNTEKSNSSNNNTTSHQDVMVNDEWQICKERTKIYILKFVFKFQITQTSQIIWFQTRDKFTTNGISTTQKRQI